MTYLALKVIIARKQQSARDGEGNRRNTTQYLVALDEIWSIRVGARFEIDANLPGRC